MTAPDDERAARALEVVSGRVCRGCGAEIADLIECVRARFKSDVALGSPRPGLV